MTDYVVKGGGTHISYNVGIEHFNIPVGTPCIRATNLPEDSEIKFWVLNWKGMTDKEKSWSRNYGFGLREDEVEKKRRR